MRAVVQRVREASVSVGGDVVGSCGRRAPDSARSRCERRRDRRRPPGREDRSSAHLRERGGTLRPISPGRRGRITRRQPVHAARRQQTPEGSSAPTSRRRRDPRSPSPLRGVSSTPSAHSAFPSRPASSVRGWPSRSSTTGQSRSFSTCRTGIACRRARKRAAYTIGPRCTSARESRAAGKGS